MARAASVLGAFLLPWTLLSAAQDPESAIERRRPQAPVAPAEAALPEIDPSQVAPPAAWLPRESLPMPDRWRVARSLGLLPYKPWDPYNPNVLKGDLPIARDWFVNLAAVSDSVVESAGLPGATQSRAAQNTLLRLGLIKGDSVFRPPDYELRFSPVLNLNRRGEFVGVQELFFQSHLRDVSVRYDFDSLRVGIQPFTADFRGLLFLDQPFGVRLFGTRDNNQWQYNAAWLRRLDKDSDSGLNDIGRGLRADDVYVFNLYRQDWPVTGFTTQAIVLHNRNAEVRDYHVTYAGLGGEGHYGRWNLSASGYRAFGHDERGAFSGRAERIGAWLGAVELSRDFDWLRVRATGVYASGDRDPFDGKAGGFDAVLENPSIAGADTSYWIRQSMPLNGVGLSLRNGLLPSLRSSREHGQSNFTNPGLRLFGLGADADLAPQLRLIGNANYLEFDELAVLELLSGKTLTSRQIGLDLSLGVQYRPLFTQNVVVQASFAVLRPGKGLRELFGAAVDATQYSALLNLVLTF
jgi:hypothetical protein